MIKKIAPYGLTLVLVAGVSIYLNNTITVSASNNASTSESSNVTKTQSISSNSITPITKEEIHYKMLNSVDNFKTAKGSFVYDSKIANEHIVVDYQVDLGQSPKSYEKIQGNINQTSINQEHIFDGQDRNYLDNNGKKYTKDKVNKSPGDLKDKSVQARYQKNSNGEKVYLYRNNPAMMRDASMSLFPQQMITGYLEDYSKWNIVSETTLNGLNAVVIEGDLNDYYKTKLGSAKFKWWVHKDTGIVLQFEEYDSNGNVISYLKTQSISIDGTIDGEKFKAKIPNDFQEIKHPVK